MHASSRWATSELFPRRLLDKQPENWTGPGSGIGAWELISPYGRIHPCSRATISLYNENNYRDAGERPLYGPSVEEMMSSPLGADPVPQGTRGKSGVTEPSSFVFGKGDAGNSSQCALFR